MNHEKISLEIFHVDTSQENYLSHFPIFKFEGTNGRTGILYDKNKLL